MKKAVRVLGRTQGVNPFGVFVPSGEIVATGDATKLSDKELRAIMRQPDAVIRRVDAVDTRRPSMQVSAPLPWPRTISDEKVAQKKKRK